MKDEKIFCDTLPLRLNKMMLTHCTRSYTAQLKARLAEGEHIAFCAGLHQISRLFDKNLSLLVEKALLAAKEAFETGVDTGELAASVAPEQVIWVFGRSSDWRLSSRL